MRIIILALACCGLTACGGGDATLRDGPWRAALDLNGAELPFTWSVQRDPAKGIRLTLRNGQEAIQVDEVALRGDSFHARMPLFDSEFIGVVNGDTAISGEWINHLKGDGYRVPFTARAGPLPRFTGACAEGSGAFAGHWEARFSPGSADAYNAVGIFDAKPDGLVTGTFLTETGDYRYLEGAACGDTMRLSCFDGTHAFLFACALRGDSLVGRFWSGTHWQEPWVAVRNLDYRLRDPDSLTTLREGFDRVAFRFKDTEGVERSPSDAEYQGKPLIVHIMGSWCPNCVDETALLAEMHAKYEPEGLRILAVAFEKHADESRAMGALRRFKKTLRVPYPVLYGGPAAKDQAASRLPFLSRLMSYPTTLFIDRQGRVRRIRTGFYGPGTGAYYERYKAQLDTFLRGLIDEPLPATAAR